MEEGKNMWKIVFARIDDRLIHGQIMTRWMKGFSSSTIVTIDDTLAVDEFMKNIYKMAAPPGVKVKVLSVNDAIKDWEKKTSTEENVFLLFKDIQVVERTVNAGLSLKVLNVGGVAKMPGRKSIIPSVSLSSQEAEILWRLHKVFNIEIYFQMVPDSERLNINHVIEKFFPKLK